MGFAEVIQTIFTQRYAKFTGRATRSEYWYFIAFYAVIALIITGLAMATGVHKYSSHTETPFLGLIVGGLGMLFFLACILPMISVSVRRLHDRDLSGWWYLAVVVASFLPVVGWLATIAFVVICALPGTDGPNRFGPDPLQLRPFTY